MTAITAVTVPDTKELSLLYRISIDIIKNQIIHTANDIKPDAIKIGMLHSSESKMCCSVASKDKSKKIILIL